MKPKISKAQSTALIETLASRFENNKQRHQSLQWYDLLAKLEKSPEKLSILHAMESTNGEPDVVDYDKKTDQWIFFDCAVESPSGRRSLCYDRQALDSRKENKPKDNVIEMAQTIGIELLTETQYRYLQTLGHFDTKTSSWIHTPASIRDLGGALFADYRFGQVFVYHNGASSYYAGRAFRGCLQV